MTRYYHGGKAGLDVGDWLIPAPPHVFDGCPICVARQEGRTFTVGEFRALVTPLGDKAAPILRMLADAADDEPIDPPSAQEAVYITTERGYARWYAARSRGDLYLVDPDGPIEATTEDHFPSFTVPRAQIVEVIERGIRLTRRERRSLFRSWDKADRRAKRRIAA